MIVKIYLRAIVHGGNKSLAMFDTNRSGDINNLITEVPYGGGKVVWKLDCCSGIKSITEISFQKGNVFNVYPKKLLFCKGFKLKLPANVYGKEKYTIKCILRDGTELPIDPFIKIPPPPG